MNVKWNKPKKQIIGEAIGGRRTMLILASRWHALYTPFVPMDTGELFRNVDYEATDFNASIIHRVPYAGRMYHGNGFRFSQDRHPLAQAQWDQGAKAAGRAKDLSRSITKLIKGGF